MVVLGSNCTIVNNTGHSVEVKPFSDDCKVLQSVPIVHAVIKYECDVTGETYFLVFKNALYVPSMDHNLIPPFIMREAGVVVNDVPKIHCDPPRNDDHCIIFKDANLRIPLKLDGVFSYFESTTPTQQEL